MSSRLCPWKVTPLKRLWHRGLSAGDDYREILDEDVEVGVVACERDGNVAAGTAEVNDVVVGAEGRLGVVVGDEVG